MSESTMAEAVQVTAQDAMRVVSNWLPKALVPIEGVAGSLGASRAEVSDLLAHLEGEDLLTIWDEHCMLSASEAERRGLMLASTPHREATGPSCWYWLHFRKDEEFGKRIARMNYYVNNPQVMPMSLLPGPYINRVRLRRDLYRLAQPTHHCENFADVESRDDDGDALAILGWPGDSLRAR